MPDCKNQQENLHRIAGTVNSPTVEDYVNDMVDVHGMKVVADRLNVNISKVSRVKNGNEGFTLKQLQDLLDMGDAVIIPRQDYLDLVEWGRTTFRMMEKAVAICGEQRRK